MALIAAIPPNDRDSQVNAALASLCGGSLNSKLKGLACDVVNVSSPDIARNQPEPGPPAPSPTNTPKTTQSPKPTETPAATRPPKASPPAGSGPSVYIQIAAEAQRPDAETLRNRLLDDNFRVEGIELVKPTSATVHTYVRFFSASGAAQASRIADDMGTLNYKAVGIQDFSAYANGTQQSQNSLEIWIGKSQGAL